MINYEVFKPLPQAALEKLIDTGNYVLAGKHEDYYIDYCDASEDDALFGKVFISDSHGDDIFTVKPEAITFNGSWFRIVDEDGYVHAFTLEQRVTTFIEDIAAELID